MQWLFADEMSCTRLCWPGPDIIPNALGLRGTLFHVCIWVCSAFFLCICHVPIAFQSRPHCSMLETVCDITYRNYIIYSALCNNVSTHILARCAGTTARQVAFSSTIIEQWVAFMECNLCLWCSEWPCWHIQNKGVPVFTASVSLVVDLSCFALAYGLSNVSCPT